MELLYVGFFFLVALQGVLLIIGTAGACFPKKKKK
jgi:hypothetical protein